MDFKIFFSATEQPLFAQRSLCTVYGTSQCETEMTLQEPDMNIVEDEQSNFHGWLNYPITVKKGLTHIEWVDRFDHSPLTIITREQISKPLCPNIFDADSICCD